MKLYSNPASPYVRKVLVVADELGLRDRIETEALKLSPVNPVSALNKSNPIGKIPTLVLDDGTALFDSRVICEYLDSIGGAKPLFPAEGVPRWTALRRQAAGDGILDAAVITRYETFLRPQALRWSEWIENQKQKLRRATDELEHEVAGFGDSVDIGTITIACALAYLDFRYADEQWRNGRPALAKWYEEFATRPSMQATIPKDLA